MVEVKRVNIKSSVIYQVDAINTVRNIRWNLLSA